MEVPLASNLTPPLSSPGGHPPIPSWIVPLAVTFTSLTAVAIVVVISALACGLDLEGVSAAWESMLLGRGNCGGGGGGGGGDGIRSRPQQQQPSAASVDATLRTLGGLARSQQRDHEHPLSSLLANDACIQPFAAGTQQKFSLSPLSAVPCGAVVPAAGAPGDEVAAAWAETSTPPPQPAERLEGTYEI